MEHVPAQGNTPHHFTLDPTGAYLFVEHQTSDSIVVFHVDQNTCKLTPSGKKLDVPMPVCVAFLPVK